MRESEGDDLPGIGGVGEDLLIAGHGGIEADLADRAAGGAEALALQHGSVGQHQKRRRLGFIPSAGGGGFRLGHGLLVAYCGSVVFVRRAWAAKFRFMRFYMAIVVLRKP